MIVDNVETFLGCILLLIGLHALPINEYRQVEILVELLNTVAKTLLEKCETVLVVLEETLKGSHLL